MIPSLSQKGSSAIRRVFESFFATNPNSLLIRGLPGTGKTTLALELLNNYQKEYRGYYISTRVSLNKLVQQFPWTKDLFKNENVVSVDDSKTTTADIRLGNTRYVIEKVLAAAIKGNALIILDSWDSLAKEVPYEERIKTEKAMVAIADAHNSIILFISEEPEKNTSAYLADGIVTTSFDIVNDQKIRILSIDKMRGTEIFTTKEIFTLEDSRLVLLPKLPSLYYKNTELFEALCCPGDLLSTGCPDLDKVFGGGIRRGSVILLEIDQNVNRFSLSLILSNFVLNNLSAGYPVIVVSSPDRPHTSVSKYLLPFCDKENLKGLALFAYGAVNEIDGNSVNSLGSDSVQNSILFVKKYEEMKKAYGKDKPVLITYDLGVNELRNSSAIRKMESNLVDGLRKIRTNGDVEIIINRTGLSSMTFSRIISDIHIRLFERNGIPLVSVERPFLGMYALTVDNNKNYPCYTLHKLV